MKYFILKYSDSDAINGNSDGLGQGHLDASFYAQNPWFEELFVKYKHPSEIWWKAWSELPKYGRELYAIKLNNEAELSDYIDFPGLLQGFLVSNKLKSLLESHAHLPEHNFFPASLIQNKKLVYTNYWWFVYNLELGANTVDFAESRFDFSNFDELDTDSSVSRKIESFDNYIKLLETHRKLPITKQIKFNKNFNFELDIFGFKFFNFEKALISERLLRIFQNEHISGYRVKKLDFAFFEQSNSTDNHQTIA